MAIPRKKIMLSVLTIVLLGLSAIALVAKSSRAVNLTLGKKVSAKAEPALVQKDQELFMEYEKLMKTIDPARKEYTQSGRLFILKEANLSEIVPKTSFLVVRKGNDCYYQLGDTETYNMYGLCVQVDHRSKDITVGHQKAFVGQVFEGGKLSQRKIREEGYVLRAENEKGKRKISLSNPKHLSYKEYAISYDMLSGKVLETFTRTANDINPEAKSGGKLIYVQFSKVTNEAILTGYDPFTIIKQKNKGFMLTHKYKGYNLIAM